MQGLLITNMTHFLTEEGELAGLHREGLKLANFLGAIVSSATQAEWDFPIQTRVRCRRRPNRRPCEGVILAVLVALDQQIRWKCSHCNDAGVISGWEGTRWDEWGAGEFPPSVGTGGSA